MKIVLMGYMASGKSVIGNTLAELLNLPFIDLDNYIEEEEQMTISDIFSKKGEIYFREIENRYLDLLLNKDANFILSLGGGTPCYANNLKLITYKSTAIYLNASINTIYERLLQEREKRPIVMNIKDTHLKEFIAKHLFERNPFYQEAHYQVSVDNKSVKEVIDEIIQLL